MQLEKDNMSLPTRNLPYLTSLPQNPQSLLSVLLCHHDRASAVTLQEKPSIFGCEDGISTAGVLGSFASTATHCLNDLRKFNLFLFRFLKHGNPLQAFPCSLVLSGRENKGCFFYY